VREIILGPPGTGKTTHLIGIVREELARGCAPERVAFVTFTRRAAEEAITRAGAQLGLDAERLPLFRTLHSLAFRELGLTPPEVFQDARMQEFAEWSGVEISPRRAEHEGTPAYHQPADRAMHLEHLARVRCVPLREQYDADDDKIPWDVVDHLARSLESYKRRHGLVDFTDMLARFLAECSPPAADVLVVDEAQDLSPLQWRVVDMLSTTARRVVVGGDDDQCHPPGTIIQTTRGGIAIEKLLPSDRVVQYDRRSQEFRWNGYPAKLAAHHHDGHLFNVNGLDCTPDHKFLIRWGRKRGFVTYLMRRGEDVRVGWCQMFNVQNTLHLEVRRKLEQADALWVLRWHATKQEASFHEQEVSIAYGIPTVMFRQVPGNSLYTQETLDTFFQRVRNQSRWEACLSDHGRKVTYPLLSSAGLHKRRSTLFEVRALNLIPELCDVPKLENKKLVWVPLDLKSRAYSGLVYSLDAPPYRYYIANEIVTHNCIYRWAGAGVEHLVQMEGRARVLEQSWRVPRTVQCLADAIITPVEARRPKHWRPRPEAGAVTYGSLEDPEVWRGEWRDGVQPVLCLARNTYVLKEYVVPALQTLGVLYEWPAQPPVPPATLAAVHTWERLRSGAAASAEAVREVYRMLGASGLTQGNRELPGVPDDHQLTLDDLCERHGLLTRAPWYEALVGRMGADAVGYLRAARAGGERLNERPRVRLSTIHSAKGGEARRVVLMTEMASRTWREMEEREDDERRVWYVAATRAREELVVVHGERPECCPWL
jgi:hypothetical protein